MSPAPDNAAVLICPSCGHIMKLARTIWRLGALPELLVFSCLSAVAPPPTP